MGVLFLLFENASGYTLFEHVKSDSISKIDEQVADLKLFSKVVKLKGFLPFKSAEAALAEQHAISEGELTEMLHNFLEMYLPKGGDGDKFSLGVTDVKIGNAISELMKIKVKSGDQVLELIRGIRLHFHHFIKNLKAAEVHQARLGLAHAYSRSKVKFNVNRVDNMIVQAIALLDQLDKDINTFAMRVREWYSWHFPELIGIVKENHLFAKLAVAIQNKSTLTEEKLPELTELTNDEDMSKQILEAAKHSMGTDLSPIDMVNIEQFASRVVALATYRKHLHEYLISKMNAVAPNLSALIGEQVAARLIAHAGSLTNLAKYPASTVQILGAEKALFRALKTRGNTPKYGLIFHSSFIGRAPPAVKGRISRYLANKCSIASRLDSFGDVNSSIFGEKMRDQVESRLEFYKSGKQPKKNVDVMAEALKEFSSNESKDEDEMDVEKSSSAMVEDEDESEKKKKKKEKKKEKKEKKRSADDADLEEQPAKKRKTEDDEESKEEKKKKKKEKKKEKKKAAEEEDDD